MKQKSKMKKMQRGKLDKYIVFSLIVLTVAGATSASVSIEAVSSTGEDIRDFNIDIESEQATFNRENIDAFEHDLPEGQYDVQLLKEGYRTIQRQILVQEDAQASYAFSMSEEEQEESTDIQITRIYSPETVCRGESFSVDFDIENGGDADQVVSTTGFGFGNILAGKSFVIDSGQTKTYRFIFTGTRGSGDKNFRVSASGQDSDSATGTVKVDDCVASGSSAAVENLDINAYPIEGREKASVGEVVRVKGFADGAKGPVELNLSINGENARKIQAGRDGYFQTYLRPETSGSKTVTISTSELSDSTTFEAVPNPSIGDIESLDKVFSGEQFELCAKVKSSVTPEVVLSENGEVVESRQAEGKVCFNVEAPESGEYAYEVRVLTYGSDDSVSKEINVLEQGPEAKSFPSQVSSVETEDSLVKVEIYNTNNFTTNYTVSLEGIKREWISEPVQNVSVSKGERKTTYFYLSPGERGEYSSNLSVKSQGKEIYQDEIEVFSTGSPPAREGFDLIKVVLLTLNIVF